MEQVEIVRYDRALHTQEVLDLLGHTTAKAQFWEWQYGGPLTSGERAIEPLVAVSVDVVVGFNGVMPVQVWVGGETLEGAWSCDFVVSESARSSGVGRRIKQRLLECGRVLLVSGASDAAARMHASMGSDLSLDVRSFRRVMRPKRMRDRALLIFQALQSFRSRGTRPTESRLAFEELIPEPGELDALWVRCKGGYSRVVVRDARYLSWRYAEHPFVRYRYLTARSADGTLDAMLVIREHQGTAHIVDYLGPGAGLSMKASLLGAAISQLQNVDSWSTYTSDQELGAALRAHGFYQTRALHRFYVMASTEVPIPASGWFLMPGDSDGDMLRAARDYEQSLLAPAVKAVS